MNVSRRINPCSKTDKPFVFISYAHKDDAEVFQILELLEKNHFVFWYDEGLLTGTEWSDVISRHIKKCVQFLVFISRNSVESSNVKDEINLASKYNKNILRVHLDRTELTDGLELTLDRRHALLKYNYDDSVFSEKLCAALDPAAVKPITSSSRIAEEALMQNFCLLNKIGSGGAGTVYLAQNRRTGAYVAVKHGSVDKTITGKTVRMAYETEKAILAEQISCFAPTIIDYYSDQSNVYLVESVVRGTSLDKMYALTEREVIEIMIKVAEILTQYHQRGIIYCDLKPQHIICDHNSCFLIDFGACWRMEHSGSSVNRMIGTPGYAAPEQYCSYGSDMNLYGEVTVVQSAVPDKIDCRTDIYGLGQVLYRTINGLHSIAHSRPIITARTANKADGDTWVSHTEIGTALPFYSLALFNQKAYRPNKNKPEPYIPPLLLAIIDKMTRERKDERFNNMDEVIETLHAYLQTLPT